MQTKRGISLVEVVVALGIIAIVFSGVITLIISAVNLELSARTRTEAIARNQKNLAEVVQLLESGCAKDANNLPGEVLEGDFTINTYCRRTNDILVEYDPFDPEDTTASSSDCGDLTTDDNYIKIISKISWSEKGVDEYYVISQIVGVD
ncbi:MAG: prepilin-type N-terminal cleavage/methylation domain-containing protein [Patescibacteria group bacterium]|nr:prepilin-type N-terminal cleavage/methylation domain-containing protein [Patescibacteria group bacterium]